MVLRFCSIVLLVGFCLFVFQKVSAQDTLFVKTGEAILVRDLKITGSIFTYRWATGDTTVRGMSIESIAFLRLNKPATLNTSYTPEQAIALQVSDSIRRMRGYAEGKNVELRQVVKLIPTAGLGIFMLSAGFRNLTSSRSNGLNVLGGALLIGFSVIPISFILATIPYRGSTLRRLNAQGQAFDPVYCEAFIKGREEHYLLNLLIVSGIGGGLGLIPSSSSR
jgi:hypothetical protein